MFPPSLLCLFSRLWWTVAWTLASAVKHNATCFYHSHVWGYRWPAVCLCSSPLGQLEPSISAPPWALLRPSAPDLNTTTTATTTTTSPFQWTLLKFDQKALLNANLFPHFHDKLSESGTLFFSKSFTGFSISPQATSSPRQQFYDASDGYKLIHCWAHSTQHVQSQPFSLRRWKALKPIIVLLEGRLPPWTLWHTFKESGRNVFRPNSVALALVSPSPHPTHTHIHSSFS